MDNANVPSERKAPGPTLLQLNEDVLTLIVSNLSPHDALRLSVTARDIHLIAQRRVVSSVTMNSHTKLASFCAYMLNDIDVRFCWLRELVLDIGITVGDESWVAPGFRESEWYRQSVEDSLASARHVADILNNATFITSLHLSPLDELLRLEPSIGSALSALPGLLELKIGHCENAQSLKVLSEHSWPAVRDLSISACRIPMPVIVLAFPNVQIMRVSNYLPCSGRARGWSILDYAEAPAQFFEEWQITCPIRHVAVTSVLAIPSIGLGYMGGATRSGEPDLAITLQLVRHATPSILSFPIMAYAALASTFWTPLVQSVSKLRGLEIDLCEFKETSDSQLVSVLSHWMETVPPILGSMSTLLYIQIKIDYHRRRHTSCVIIPGMDPKHSLPTETLGEAFVSLVAKAIPSIRYLSVSFTHPVRLPWGSTNHPTPWWKAVSTGEERIVQQIPSEVGERMRSLLISPDYSNTFDLEEL